MTLRQGFFFFFFEKCFTLIFHPQAPEASLNETLAVLTYTGFYNSTHAYPLELQSIKFKVKGAVFCGCEFWLHAVRGKCELGVSRSAVLRGLFGSQSKLQEERRE